jgi:chemotaxis protein methyltransferase CheR
VTGSEAAAIEALETRLFLEAICERYGYDLRGYEPDSIRRRVGAALAKSGCANLAELQHHVLRTPSLFATVIEQLTVNVSEMFRDPAFYRAFRERVIPVLRTYPQLKVWHAGCATGEEVYATAILLLEEGLYDRVQIYATDLVQSSLDLAREGVYSETQLTTFAENYRASGGSRCFEDYYSKAYGRIAMREGLKKNVVFFQHNLVSDYALGEMQVIFCRNVLFYFGAPLRKRVLQMFAGGLCRGGFLCLGASEAAPDSAGVPFANFDGEKRIYRQWGEA